MILKACKHCLIEKPLEEFPKRNDYKNGYRTKCKTCYSEYQKEYQKEYYKTNIEKITERKHHYRRSDSYREKDRNSKDYKRICRNVLSSVLYRIKKNKNDLKTEYILQYTFEDFKKNIENKFKEGMCWENHGEWHIDHIKPISKFSPDTEIKIINSLDNLQPLWKK